MPAVTLNGYLPGTLIIQGTITKDIFVWWLRHRVIPQLRPGMIIVMDNASIHHNLGLEDELREAGLSIEYLPPYSPDFNPIECTFHAIKAWVQRHVSEVPLYARFDEFLLKAVEEAIGSDMSEYWRSCGYG